MTDREKVHDIHVAYSLINTILEDTDEDMWAYEFLEEALVALDKWFEEGDI